MAKTVALVTGGSSGIGLAIAREFARRGHALVLVARAPDRLSIAAAELRQCGASAVATHSIDLAEPLAESRMRTVVQDHEMPVDILVNSAGAFESRPVIDTTCESIGATFALNVAGLHASVRAILPGMLERRRGNILNVGSLAGLVPTPTFAAYGASKAFVQSYSLALRQELRGTGVTVSVLAPGLVSTDLVTRAAVSEVARWAYRLSSSPETVALCAYRGMVAGDAVIVPGLSSRLLWYGMRLLPATSNARILAALTAMTGQTAGGQAAMAHERPAP